MKYSISITKTAKKDISRAADYKEFVLKNPKAADDLLDEADHQLNSLSSFPGRYRLVDDPVLASWGIRFIPVNGYLAFFKIFESSETVVIVRFLFQKSNWNTILRHSDTL